MYRNTAARDVVTRRGSWGGEICRPPGLLLYLKRSMKKVKSGNQMPSRSLTEVRGRNLGKKACRREVEFQSKVTFSSASTGTATKFLFSAAARR